jgi:hypothetical protein
MMEANRIRELIAAKAAIERIDLASGATKFVVAKFTPQAQTAGPLLWGFSDLNEAHLFAERQLGEVYLMSSNPNHGLQKVRDGHLVFMDEEQRF